MTKPNHEAIAETNLLRQGFTSYCPRFLKKRPNKKPLILPLFSRYIFVDIDQAWYSIEGTRGISYVLVGEGGPLRIANSVVSDLKSREDKKGLVSLATKPKFQVGDTVKVIAGPLAGNLMIYEDMSTHDRVQVLFELLGRKVRVEIEEKLLAAA